jgi:hypothetical protein
MLVEASGTSAPRSASCLKLITALQMRTGLKYFPIEWPREHLSGAF